MCVGVREWMPGFWGRAQVSRLPGKSLIHSSGYYSVTVIKCMSREGFIWVLKVPEGEKSPSITAGKCGSMHGSGNSRELKS